MLKIIKKKPLTDFGKHIEHKLIDLDKTQSWLIGEINKKYPDAYIDSSNMYKIKVGKIKSGKIVSAIAEVLEIKKDGEVK